MRPERNPLDLNNLPEDSTRDGKQATEDSSSHAATYRKKKSGGRVAKEDCEKVYECRFCSLKFCKSQALGGHMNRHRQERETETLNRARQLVYTNDNLLAPGAHHLGGQPIPHGGFQPAVNLSDPTLTFTPVYPTRLFSAGSSATLSSAPPPPPPPPTQPYMYATPPSLVPFPAQHTAAHQVNDYFVGHALPGATSSHYLPASSDTNYTCIGAVFGHGPFNGNGSKRGSAEAVGNTGSGGSVCGRDMTIYNRFQN